MTKKKLLTGIVAGAALLIVLAVAYVFITLGRVQHVSVDEAREIAEQSLDSGEAAELLGIAPTPVPVAGVISGEEPTPDPNFQGDFIEEGEVELSEAPQTELTLTEEERLMQDFSPDVVNILLLGVDRRGSKGASRADTMFIATLDKANNKLKLSSLMRDMYVPIPEQGEQRINTSSVYGGPGLTIDTINQNFSMDIKDYVLVDFRMFEKMVDALGGITMTLTAGEVSAANDCIAGLNKQRGIEDIRSGFLTKAGSVRLDGKQALGYARIRHYGNGDYQRTSRQFKVLLTIFEKFKDMDIITQQKVIHEILPFVETSLDSVQIIDLAMRALSIGTSEILHYRLPVDGMYQSRRIRGMSVLLPDINANAQALHEFVYRMTDSPIQEDSLAVGAIGTYVAPAPLPDPTPVGETPAPVFASELEITPEPTAPPPIELPGIFETPAAPEPAPDDMFQPLF